MPVGSNGAAWRESLSTRHLHRGCDDEFSPHCLSFWSPPSDMGCSAALVERGEARSCEAKRAWPSRAVVQRQAIEGRASLVMPSGAINSVINPAPWPETTKAFQRRPFRINDLRCSSLAPRPGFEPGTHGLTVAADRSERDDSGRSGIGHFLVESMGWRREGSPTDACGNFAFKLRTRSESG